MLLCFGLAAVGCGYVTTEDGEREAPADALEEDTAAWSLSRRDCSPEAIRSRLATPAELRTWNDRLRAQGPRHAGSKAQNDFHAFLKGQLEGTRATFQSYSSKATLWTAESFELATLDASGVMTPRPTAAYFPNSGSGAVTAKAVAVKTNLLGQVDWLAAAGKIAVVRWTPPTLTVGSMRGGDHYIWWKDTSVPGIDLEAPYMRGPATLTYPDLLSGTWGKGAAAAGVRGVVIATTLPESLLARQYGAFHRAYAGVPAVVLGTEGSPWLEAALAKQEPVRLTLKASRVPTTVESFVATIPGLDAAANSLLLVTHTDGPNEMEENGGLGLVSLARAAAGCNRRTLRLIFAGGHMNVDAHSAGTLLEQNPHLYSQPTSPWTRKITTIGAISLEHLGARHFTVAASGAFQDSGEGLDPGMIFVSSLGKADHLKDAFIAAAETNGIDRSFISGLSHTVGVMLGEGIGPDKLGIRTFGFAPMPDTLLKEQRPGLGTPELVDVDAMAVQLRAFSDMITTLQDPRYDAFGGKGAL
jgi:hypothetical protein